MLTSVLRAFLLEDEPWVRTSVSATLRESGSYSLEAECSTIAEASQALVTLPELDVALVDLGLPDGSGLDLIPKIRALFPRAGIVAFTVFEEPTIVFSALRAGARGYLLKSTPLGELPVALREVAEGGAPMSPAIARMVLDAFAPLPSSFSPPAAPYSAPALSPREREILGLLALGHTYADVGRALGIRLGTVQGHVKTLYDKLCVSSKAEAAVEAIRLGLV